MLIAHVSVCDNFPGELRYYSHKLPNERSDDIPAFCLSVKMCANEIMSENGATRIFLGAIHENASVVHVQKRKTC